MESNGIVTSNKGKTDANAAFSDDCAGTCFSLLGHGSMYATCNGFKTDIETVRISAFEMRLKEQENVEEWMEKGYISILRSIWKFCHMHRC